MWLSYVLDLFCLLVLWMQLFRILIAFLFCNYLVLQILFTFLFYNCLLLIVIFHGLIWVCGLLWKWISHHKVWSFGCWWAWKFDFVLKGIVRGWSHNWWKVTSFKEKVFWRRQPIRWLHMSSMKELTWIFSQLPSFLLCHVSLYNNLNHLLAFALDMLCRRHVNMPWIKIKVGAGMKELSLKDVQAPF